jgi:hypothetical protein
MGQWIERLLPLVASVVPLLLLAVAVSSLGPLVSGGEISSRIPDRMVEDDATLPSHTRAPSSVAAREQPAVTPTPVPAATRTPVPTVALTTEPTPAIASTAREAEAQTATNSSAAAVPSRATPQPTPTRPRVVAPVPTLEQPTQVEPRPKGKVAVEPRPKGKSR